MNDPTRNAHEYFMSLALEEARIAAREGEVPIGAVAVLEGEPIARDHNRSIQLSDPTAHAEMLVLRDAGRLQGNYRLNGLTIYTTVEPCAMCAGALIWARIEALVFGAFDQKAGAITSQAQLLRAGRFNHDVEYLGGVLAEECRQLLQQFFQDRRS